MAESEGRWFVFRLDGNSLLILERKSAGEHLKGLDCLETPSTVTSVLKELEDSGEALGLNHPHNSHVQPIELICGHVPSTPVNHQLSTCQLRCFVLSSHLIAFTWPPNHPIKTPSCSQVKIKVSHHTVDKDTATVAPAKDLVFTMDELVEEEPGKKPKGKGKKEKKDAKPDVTAKNFGTRLRIPTFKNSQHLKVAWQCRIDSQTEGVKMIMPIRPVACLAGMVDIDQQNLSLM